MPRFRRHKKMGHVPKAVKAYVKRAVKLDDEVKNVTGTLTLAGTIADVGTIFSSVGMATGTNLFERIGYKIAPGRYDLKLWFTATSAAIIRCLLICVKQQSSTAVPAITNILVNATAANPNAPMSAFANIAQSNETYTVLHDSTLVLSTGSGFEKVFHPRIKPPKSIHFQGTNAADVGKNTMYWIFVSNQPVAGNNITARGYDQLWYRDA